MQVCKMRVLLWLLVLAPFEAAHVPSVGPEAVVEQAQTHRRTLQQDIPDTFDVTHYGAQGDGKTLNTKVFEHVVGLVKQRGHGTMLFPAPGRYLSAPFNLTSNLKFVVEKGS